MKENSERISRLNAKDRSTVGICASLSLQLCLHANLARIKHSDAPLIFLKFINFINRTLISRTQYLCWAWKSMNHSSAQCAIELDLHG